MWQENLTFLITNVPSFVTVNRVENRSSLLSLPRGSIVTSLQKMRNVSTVAIPTTKAHNQPLTRVTCCHQLRFCGGGSGFVRATGFSPCSRSHRRSNMRRSCEFTNYSIEPQVCAWRIKDEYDLPP